MVAKGKFLAFVVGGALGLWLIVGSARGNITLLNENFNDDPVNGVPNTPNFFLGQVGSNPDSTIQIAGPGGSYTDPFVGDATNRSLVLDNFAGGVAFPSVQFPIVGWRSQFPPIAMPALQQAKIDFDLIMGAERPTDFWSYFEIRVGFTGFPSTVADTILWNSWRIQGGSPLIFNNGQNQLPNTSPIVPNQKMHVSYEIFADQTWSLTVDGTPILYAGQAKVPWMSNIAGSGMKNLFFFNAFNLNNAPSYVDNLVVTTIPEPGSLALLACGGLLGLAGLHRRRR